jgi:hypothetical protein
MYLFNVTVVLLRFPQFTYIYLQEMNMKKDELWKIANNVCSWKINLYIFHSSAFFRSCVGLK